MDHQKPTFTPSHIEFLPRVIRAKDAPRYLGMSRDVFTQQVKPYVTVVPIGKQGIGYDRLELDDWWEDYKKSNGFIARPSPQYTISDDTNIGQKHSNNQDADFYAALERIKKMKPKRS